MDELTTKAFVLRTRDYGESDRIVVLLSEELGKVSAIAKGARRSHRRFAGGALEPFGELLVRMAPKSYGSLAFLHESRVISANTKVAADLDAYAWASYLTELTELMTVEHDPSRDLYGFYREVIARLGTGPSEPVAHHYVLGLLERSGWAPDLDACGICAEPVTEFSRPMLDARGSGVVCSRHEAEALGIDPQDESFRPSRRIIDEALLSYVRRAANDIPDPAESGVSDLASALLERLVDLHLGRNIRSRAFLKDLRVERRRAGQTAQSPKEIP